MLYNTWPGITHTMKFRKELGLDENIQDGFAHVSECGFFSHLDWLEQWGTGWTFLSPQVLFKFIGMVALMQSCQQGTKGTKSQTVSSSHSVGQSTKQGQPRFNKGEIESFLDEENYDHISIIVYSHICRYLPLYLASIFNFFFSFNYGFS